MLTAILVGLVAAVLGAVVGSFVTWMLGASDRAQAREALAAQKAAGEAQQRIAELEAERSRTEAFSRFAPRSQVVDGANSQSLRLEADQPFEVEAMDYLNANEARVASQPVGKTDKSIDIPIDEAYLVQIQNLGPWVSTYDRSAEVIFRVHLRKDGQYKEHKHKGLIKPEARNAAGAVVFFRRVIG